MPHLILTTTVDGYAHFQKRKQVQSNEMLPPSPIFYNGELQVEVWNVIYGRCGNGNAFEPVLSYLVLSLPVFFL